MRTSLLLWGLLAALAGAAVADENDLTGGVLITHRVSQLVYTDDGPDWCQAYYAYALTTSADQLARVDGPIDHVVWYVLAAWAEPKVWCGNEFGFASYNAGLFSFEDYGPCYPSGVGLELPTSGWPGPNQGTAYVSTSGNWGGNYTPIYWFAGYAYGAGVGSTVIQLGLDPGNDAISFANCATHPLEYSVAPENRGGLGINTSGVMVHPVAVELDRVCCDPVTHACTIRTQAQCLAQGGEWRQDLTTCSPNPCLPTGACCYGTTIIRCAVLTEADCRTRPHPVYGTAIWRGEGIPCDPFPCLVLPERVCCKPDLTCEVLTEYQCDALDGTWHENYTSCSQAQCAALGACCIGTTGVCMMAWEAECKLLNGMSPSQQFVPGRLWHPTHVCGDNDPCSGTPALRSSWGSIKRLYR